LGIGGPVRDMGGEEGGDDFMSGAVQPSLSCVSPHCSIFSYPMTGLLCPSTSAVLMEEEVVLKTPGSR